MSAVRQLRQVAPAAPPAIELSIVMPCLDEAETIAMCVRKAKAFLDAHGVVGEVIVADNGSTDGSQTLANALGARVIGVGAKGYGAALAGGIEAARGRYVIMGDADDSYDFAALMPFVAALRDGAELVMGNRFAGGIAEGAMPRLHRYLGNPVLSALGRLFYGSPVRDFHCGLRGFRRDAIMRLGLQAPGMEYASEMVVRATIERLDVREVPTTLQPDGRSRAPHLRFLLTYAPKWLFVYPGLALALPGLAGVVTLATAPLEVGRVELGVHTLLFAAMAVLLGSQLVSFGLLARIYGVASGMWPAGRVMRAFRQAFTMERGCVAGALLSACGIAAAASLFLGWAGGGYGPTVPAQLMRMAIPAMLATCLGAQLVFTSFFVALLDSRRR